MLTRRTQVASSFYGITVFIFALQDGHFTYSYRVRPGVNRESHGLKVAELAGLPQSALKVASEALQWLKTQSEGEILHGSRLRTLGQSLARQSAREGQDTSCL